MELNINVDGQIMREGVGLNYREKYIKMETSGVDGKTQAAMIHELSEVKINILLFGYCNFHHLIFYYLK